MNDNGDKYNIKELVEVLNSIEFTSKRKRMSVIVCENVDYKLGNYTPSYSTTRSSDDVYDFSNPESIGTDGQTTKSLRLTEGGSTRLRLYIKGADTAILPRLRSGQDQLIATTEKQVNAFSDEGLRCLYIGYVDLTISHYQSWIRKYKAALTDLKQIEAKKKGYDAN